MTTLEPVRSGHVVVGVDTHKHIHVAAVMDTIGGILATLTVTTDTGGFNQLLNWSSGFGKVSHPGVFGGRIPWKDLSHGTSQQVPARAS